MSSASENNCHLKCVLNKIILRGNIRLFKHSTLVHFLFPTEWFEINVSCSNIPCPFRIYSTFTAGISKIIDTKQNYAKIFSQETSK